ncbi:MAG: AAA family ATPase [Armatimonadetes bacterium]|nr:AAA family ATPase [Armatimonadota bacterium]
MKPFIVFVTGAPAAGKSTVCKAILERLDRGVHIPVDDLRTWVAAGLADSVPWTEETERQFQIAEAAASDVAKRYWSAGFTVAVDHCRNLPRLDAVIAEHLDELPVLKVCLTCDLESNLRRNRERTHKDFHHSLLTETIEYLNPRMAEDPPAGWMVVDNRDVLPEEVAARVLALAGEFGTS